MATKVMALKRDGACSVCATPLAAGARAQWDNVAKAVTCLTCVDSIAAPSVAAVPTPPLPPIDVGTPGASAQNEFERRHAKHERRIEEEWGTGRPVLDNNRPRLAEDTNDHGACGPSRNPAARAAAPTASTASPNSVVAGASAPNNGSKPWANTVNHTRIASALRAKRRNHPRTVEAGTPNANATRR